MALTSWAMCAGDVAVMVMRLPVIWSMVAVMAGEVLWVRKSTSSRLRPSGVVLPLSEMT